MTQQLDMPEYTNYQHAPFPPELAILIARKVDAMAQQFEDKALDQLFRAAQRNLDLGIKPAEIARQMGL